MGALVFILFLVYTIKNEQQTNRVRRLLYATYTGGTLRVDLISSCSRPLPRPFFAP